MRLWVDDVRTPPDSYDSPHNPGETISPSWWWAKTSKAAIDSLRYHNQQGINPFVEISLDHDLGGDDTTRPVVLWMCEHNVWPEIVGVHTANPVGREWLEGMIARYKPLTKGRAPHAFR